MLLPTDCGRNQPLGARAIESKANDSTVTKIGIDIGKTSFRLVGLEGRGAIVLRDTPFQGPGTPALEVQATRLLPRLLAGFATDPSIVLLGRETIYRDGKRTGWLASGGYGYTVDRSIGYGYVRGPENGLIATRCCPAARRSRQCACPPRFFLDPLYNPRCRE